MPGHEYHPTKQIRYAAGPMAFNGGSFPAGHLRRDSRCNVPGAWTCPTRITACLSARTRGRAPNSIRRPFFTRHWISIINERIDAADVYRKGQETGTPSQIDAARIPDLLHSERTFWLPLFWTHNNKKQIHALKNEQLMKQALTAPGLPGNAVQGLDLFRRTRPTGWPRMICR